MNASKAFAAIALAAVACDGAMGREEAKALRAQLDHRTPFAGLSDQFIGGMFDDLLQILREEGIDTLVAGAIPSLQFQQRETALAVAAQLVHSDRLVEPAELDFLDRLSAQLELPEGRAAQILEVIEILNRDSLAG
jgi:hypothetical protein